MECETLVVHPVYLSILLKKLALALMKIESTSGSNITPDLLRLTAANNCFLSTTLWQKPTELCVSHLLVVTIRYAFKTTVITTLNIPSTAFIKIVLNSILMSL